MPLPVQPSRVALVSFATFAVRCTVAPGPLKRRTEPALAMLAAGISVRFLRLRLSGFAVEREIKERPKRKKGDGGESPILSSLFFVRGAKSLTASSFLLSGPERPRAHPEPDYSRFRRCVRAGLLLADSKAF